MANEPNRPDLDDDADEPTEEEIEREKSALPKPGSMTTVESCPIGIRIFR